MASLKSPPPSRATKADPPFLNFFPRNASLHGVEFPSSCPPDVSPKTRIVAVCGITSFDDDPDDDPKDNPEDKAKAEKDRSAPSRDGWFFSDFWLFNHLLRNAPVRNQIWLTCSDPRLLVKKYVKYSHGNPFKERRIVLDEQLLGPIEAAGTLRVVQPDALLERFVKTVQAECKHAVKANESVLLLVFGHGDIKSFGVTLGSHSNKEFDEVKAPRLTIKHLRIAVGNKANCTLLMTSCYSGGWAMCPDLNMTIMAAAGFDETSQSWNESYGRAFSGGVFVSAVLDAIISSEIEDEASVGKPEIQYQELQGTATYAEMACLIHDHLKQSDRFHDTHNISFSAQDDSWAEAWRERTGIPLAFFKQRWEELTVLPAQPDNASNRDPASQKAGSDPRGFNESRTGSTSSSTPSMSKPQIYNIVRSLAVGYMQSFPGPNYISSNHVLHDDVRQLLSGKNRYKNRMVDLLELGYMLSYRLDSMAIATQFKDLLGLEYPDCNRFSVEEWIHPLCESEDPMSKEKLKRHNYIKTLIYNAEIMSYPSAGQGYAYLKPLKYLASSLVDSPMTNQEVEEAITTLKNLHTASVAPKVDSVRRGGWFRDRADLILKPVKKTLRSISPSRKRRSTILSK